MRLGLVVNPIAGIGGALAFKGSDGDLAAHALAAGAAPVANIRAALALAELQGCSATIVTSEGAMGEDVALTARLPAEVVYRTRSPTSADDTIGAARVILAEGVDLLVFVGGDGTARDLVGARAIISRREFPPLLGVPAGVKMLSGVFATSPRRAGRLLAEWNERGIPPCQEADVLDRDENGCIRLYGALPVPVTSDVQAAKAARDGAPGAGLRAAAEAMAKELRGAPLAFVGPGSTMLMVKQSLAGAGTLLGVDAYVFGQPAAIDADLATLSALAATTHPRIVLGIVGGQGFLLGRGNQQLAPSLLLQAGRGGLEVLADADKLARLPSGELLVDSGDAAIDEVLSGFISVRTGLRKRMIMRVKAA